MGIRKHLKITFALCFLHLRLRNTVNLLMKIRRLHLYRDQEITICIYVAPISSEFADRKSYII